MKQTISKVEKSNELAIFPQRAIFHAFGKFFKSITFNLVLLQMISTTLHTFIWVAYGLVEL